MNAPDLSLMTRDELISYFGDIVVRPGDFSQQDLDDIAAINVELMRRDVQKCKAS